REEAAVLDHQVDSRDVHMDDAARADVQVAYLAVSHLAVWQSHVLAAGVDQRIGILTQQAVVGWLVRQCNGIGFGLRAVAPAIKDDKYERFGSNHEVN